MVKQNNIAIIGTGFSAATLKYFLKSEVDFFEKSRGIGGRSSTRKVEGIGSFDHGLQYISTNHEEFSTFLGSNENNIWDGKFIINFNKNKSLDSKKRIIHSEGNNKLIKKIFEKSNIFFQKELREIKRNKDTWNLIFKDDTEANYKTVLITVPFQQALNLTKSFTSDFYSKFNFQMDPNLTVMVAFNKSLGLDYASYTYKDDPELGFAANENTKKPYLLNNKLELWTIQSSVKFAKKYIQNYRENKNLLTEQIVKAFLKSVKINYETNTIIHQDIHGWLYAYGKQLSAPNSFWNEDLKLGICGDYFSGFKAEHAFLSAKHLCLQVQKTLL
ncbi:MAG: NAD(P)-binding protein [Candidatus Fonsibacter sp.]